VILVCDRESFPNGRPPTVVPEQTSADEALAVETVVVEDRGQFAVEVVVVFADGIVRKRIDIHRTRRLADIAAGLIKRAAERDLRGPLNG
jgi:hypothetical protein